MACQDTVGRPIASTCDSNSGNRRASPSPIFFHTTLENRKRFCKILACQSAQPTTFACRFG